MENEMKPQAPKDEAVNGVEHRLLDGYDGGEAPPPEFIEKLLASAPPEVQARAKAFATERSAAGSAGDKKE
jgi:hypothetical protein